MPLSPLQERLLLALEPGHLVRVYDTATTSVHAGPVRFVEAEAPAAVVELARMGFLELHGHGTGNYYRVTPSGRGAKAALRRAVPPADPFGPIVEDPEPPGDEPR